MAPCMKSAVLVIALSTCSIFVSFYLFNLINRKRKQQSDSSKEALTSAPEDIQFHSLDGSTDSTSNTNPSDLSVREAKFLTELLGGTQTNLIQKEQALVTIANSAAFSRNHKVFRDVGCLQKLLGLVQSYRLSLSAGGVIIGRLSSEGGGDSVGFSKQDAKLLQTTLRAVNNLAMNEVNQTILQDGIPNLLYLSMSDHCDLHIRLAAMEALTNLSVTPAYHVRYARDIDALTECFCRATADKQLRLQILRLLVNLSCNADMASHLWRSRLSSATLEQLEDASLQTRWLNIVKNTVSNVPSLQYSDIFQCEQLMMKFYMMFHLPGDVGALANEISQELMITVQNFIISKTN